MKRIIIDLPDGYDGVLIFTAIGKNEKGINVASGGAELSGNDHFKVDENGVIKRAEEVI